MSNIGELKRGYEIGKKSKRLHIWSACSQCGKGRWVQFINGQARNNTCLDCQALGNLRKLDNKGELHPNWKGGKKRSSQGYILVHIEASDPFFCMADCDGYVFEHRLVMARHLNRPLLSAEHIHHINGIKTDNSVANLMILTELEHGRLPETIERCKENGNRWQEYIQRLPNGQFAPKE